MKSLSVLIGAATAAFALQAGAVELTNIPEKASCAARGRSAEVTASAKVDKGQPLWEVKTSGNKTPSYLPLKEAKQAALNHCFPSQGKLF